MLIELRKELHQKEEGQALVLGALSMLIIALILITTINLGKAAYEKVRLQNAADAQAYSIAVVVARNFNFQAFSNRAQVAHYVSAMTFQSWLSYLWKLVTVFQQMKKVAGNADLYCGGGQSPKCFLQIIGQGICKVVEGALGIPISTAIQQINQFVSQFVDVIKKITEVLDTLIATIVIPAHSFLNFANYLMQEASKMATYYTVASLSSNQMGPIWTNAPELFALKNPMSMVNGIANLTMNTLSLNSAYDSKASILSLPKNKAEGMHQGSGQQDAFVKKTKTVMTQVSNASRNPKDLVGRKGLGGLTGIAIQFGLGLKDIASRKGQAKMTGAENRGTKQFEEDIYGSHSQAKAPLGDALVAADPVKISPFWGLFCKIPFTKCKERVAGVTAAKSGGFHQFYEAQLHSVCKLKIWGACIIRCREWKMHRVRDEHGSHKWFGLMPYVKFKPNPDPKKDFGQPSFLSWMQKQSNHFSNKDKVPFAMHFEFKGHVRDAGFDSRLGNKGLFNTIGGPMKGVHALSRSMTYYHRPGNWKEQPNMFNPYWRAKLAPISHSFMTALAKVGLSPGGGMAKFLEEFITH